MEILFSPVYYEFSKEEKEELKKIIEKYLEKYKEKVVFTITPYKKVLEGILSVKIIEILGCFVPIERVNKAIFVGDGLFHPIEICKKLGKDVIIINPLRKTVKEINCNAYMRKFNLKLEKLKEKFLKAKKVGIFTSIKPGQNFINEAIKIKEKLEKLGKEVYLFIGDEFLEREVINFYKIDFWVVFACPRIMDVNIPTFFAFKNFSFIFSNFKLNFLI